jgi:phage/plasmid-associated DNA primase
LDHVRETLGEKEADFLLDYVAHMVQMTTQKPGTMIILTGKPGVGKTVICDIIAHMLGRQNAIVVDSAAFTQSNFNGLFSGKLFVTINELNVATRRDHTLTGKIKSWITDENYTVNAKFQAQRNEKSFHRFMATTNSDIPFPIDTDDRRIALFSVGDKFRNSPDHFVPLFPTLKH